MKKTDRIRKINSRVKALIPGADVTETRAIFDIGDLHFWSNVDKCHVHAKGNTSQLEILSPGIVVGPVNSSENNSGAVVIDESKLLDLLNLLATSKK